jgi:hypothetical protein
MYYAARHEGSDLISTDQIRDMLLRARVSGARNLNIASVLAQAGEIVESPGKSGGLRVWRLTGTGLRYVRDILGIPEQVAEIENDVQTLSELALTIRDLDVREYVLEAIECLRFGALRAAVVFLWIGAARDLQRQVIARPARLVNAALTKHDPKSRAVRTLDDFANVKESILLLVAQELGILDKGQRQMVEQALDLRNKCGHPGKYKPGTKKVSAFIEDVVSILFTQPNAADQK